MTDASTLLRQHRRFLACDPDPSCMTETMPQLILIYSGQASSGEIEVDREEHVCSSAEVYVSTVETTGVRKRLDVPEISKGHLHMQTLPPHILYHLSPYFGEKELFQKARTNPSNQCGVKWLETEYVRS